MIITNPVNLEPFMAAMKADMDALDATIKASNEALKQAVNEGNQAITEDISALSVVNGEISSEVQAINSHTTQELSALALSPVKNVYHISRNGAGAIEIPEVNLSKALVICNSSGGANAFLYSKTQVILSGVNTLYAVVIEYA
ncbi:hypothetical protein MA794_001658 [Vibrio vulnificus]|nr:hypothetical protein [Vibrio vulnificus]